MAFYFEPEQDPLVPAVQGHQANEEATAAVDARQSRETLERQIRRELGNPVHRKLQEAIESRRLNLYLLMALAFLCILAFEWAVSRELYEVWFPAMAWVPFLACTGVGLFISACLAESVTHFALFNLADEAAAEREGAVRDSLGGLYGERRPRKSATAWMFQPATGVVFGVLFLSGIYLGSQNRVDLLRASGQDSIGAFHLYLPVILYGVEIIFGMPTVFWLICVHGVVRTRRLRTALAKAKRSEDTLRRSAIQNYTSYLHGYNAYSDWAGQQRRMLPILVPTNAPLKRFLTEEGYDLTQPGASEADIPPTQASSTPVDGDGKAPAGGDEVSPQSERGPEQQPAPRSEPQAQQTPNNSSREEDLLGLLDAQIAAQNRGF